MIFFLFLFQHIHGEEVSKYQQIQIRLRQVRKDLEAISERFSELAKNNKKFINKTILNQKYNQIQKDNQSNFMQLDKTIKKMRNKTIKYIPLQLFKSKLIENSNFKEANQIPDASPGEFITFSKNSKLIFKPIHDCTTNGIVFYKGSANSGSFTLTFKKNKLMTLSKLIQLHFSPGVDKQKIVFDKSIDFDKLIIQSNSQSGMTKFTVVPKFSLLFTETS